MIRLSEALCSLNYFCITVVARALLNSVAKAPPISSPVETLISRPGEAQACNAGSILGIYGTAYVSDHQSVPTLSFKYSVYKIAILVPFF